MKTSILALVCCTALLITGTLGDRSEETRKEQRKWKKLLKQGHKNACVPGADVAIVLDTSKSIKIRNLKKIKMFLAELVDRFEVSPSASRIGLIRYNKKGRLVFDFNEHKSNLDVKTAIREFPTSLGWQTRTDKGMQKALTHLFTPKGGDRADRENILFVLTDGKPTGLKKPDFTPLKEVAASLEEKGVTIVAVGYGRRVKEETLIEIAGDNGHHLKFDDIGSFLKQVELIVSQTCVIPVDGQWSEWSSWGECSVTCGGGTRTRGRSCTEPAPEHGGKDCEGNSEDSEECRMDPCEPPCKHIDIGVIADISKSVKMSNLPVLRDALKTIVDKFEISSDGSHMGLITFAKSADLRFSFAQDEFQDVDKAKENIDGITQLFLQTRTDKALTLANKQLFTAAGGDRPDKPSVLLVFTDGKPTQTDRPDYKDFDVTVPPLEDKGVKIIAIGIGKGIDQDILHKIAGQNGKVISVDNFSSLADELEVIKDLACDAASVPKP